ncbi:hypothetical protein ACTA71_008769 [Dictyostelium dimigraforme]
MDTGCKSDYNKNYKTINQISINNPVFSYNYKSTPINEKATFLFEDILPTILVEEVPPTPPSLIDFNDEFYYNPTFLIDNNENINEDINNINNDNCVKIFTNGSKETNNKNGNVINQPILISKNSKISNSFLKRKPSLNCNLHSTKYKKQKRSSFILPKIINI